MVLEVPKSYTVTALDYTDLFQYNAGAGSGYVSVISVLTDIKSAYEGLFGGTLSCVITEDATTDIYTITWDGITTDPESDPSYGNPVAISIYSFDGGSQASAQWTYAAICPCPPSVNPDDAEDCLDCYEGQMSFCDDTFDVEGLEASKDYTIKVVDNVSGMAYQVSATADAFGIATLDLTDFPSGLFTPFNSPLTLTVTDSNGDAVVLTYGYVNYSCINIQVINTSSIA